MKLKLIFFSFLEILHTLYGVGLSKFFFQLDIFWLIFREQLTSYKFNNDELMEVKIDARFFLFTFVENFSGADVVKNPSVAVKWSARVVGEGNGSCLRVNGTKRISECGGG